MSNDILIVDDESDIRTLLCGILEDEGYFTREAANSEQAYAEINARLPSLVILDIWLHGSEQDGVDILKWVKTVYPSVPVIMISGHGNIETAVNSIKAGAYEFIEKPFQADKLVLLIKRALEAWALTNPISSTLEATPLKYAVSFTTSIEKLRLLIYLVVN